MNRTRCSIVQHEKVASASAEMKLRAAYKASLKEFDLPLKGFYLFNCEFIFICLWLLVPN